MAVISQQRLKVGGGFGVTFFRAASLPAGSITEEVSAVVVGILLWIGRLSPLNLESKDQYLDSDEGGFKYCDNPEFTRVMYLTGNHRTMVLKLPNP